MELFKKIFEVKIQLRVSYLMLKSKIFLFTNFDPSSNLIFRLPKSYKDLEVSLKRLIIDFQEQEKRFLNEVDDLNAYDNVLHQAQDKVNNLQNYF